VPCDHAWSPRRSQALSDPQRARRPLSEPARRLWEDAADRSSALATIAAAARADGPDELVAAFDAAVTEGKDADALRLAAEHAREVLPKLDAEQFAATTSLLESAQLIVDMADAAGRQPRSDSSTPPRPGAAQPQTKASRRRA